MKEIFQEYGGILITVVAILSIILVITAVIGSDADSIIGKAFNDLIQGFLARQIIVLNRGGQMELGKEYFGPLWSFGRKR